MSQIRYNILYNQRVKEAKKVDKELRRLHITTPITLDNETENAEELQANSQYWNVSDDEVSTNQFDNFGEGGSGGDSRGEKMAEVAEVVEVEKVAKVVEMKKVAKVEKVGKMVKMMIVKA